MRAVLVRCACALSLSMVCLASSAEPKRPFLFKDSRGELADAHANDKRTVSLLIASAKGMNSRVAEEAHRLGGEVRYREDSVDYLRVAIAPDAVEALVAFPQVQSADIQSNSDRRADIQLPSADDASLPPSTDDPWPPQVSDYPLSKPYSAYDDLDITRLLAESPTFDGRGVVIGHVEGYIDLLRPEFQQALSLDGKPVPKVLDYLTASDPLEQDETSNIRPWVAMKTQVSVRGRSFEFNGQRFSAPKSGTFRVAMFDEGEFYPLPTRFDVNRDGDPEGSSRLFGVLWEEQTGTVWVDTDQDGDFNDEKGMREFAIARDIGVFGKDDPNTAVRETVGFTVQIDKRNKFVAILCAFGGHSSAVAAAAAANGKVVPQGRVSGIAPNAQLISIEYGFSTGGAVEGLIAAFKDRRIDVVLFEQSVFIDNSYRLKDGRFTPTIVIARLIDRYNKLFLVPGDNLPGLNRASDYGASGAALAVGAYQSQANFLNSNGIVTRNQDNLHWVGSYGPAGNGAMLPDVMAPSAIISITSIFKDDPARNVNGLYRLPPGYMMCSGTSCATPVATGTVALLISAAKQRGVKYDAQRLRHALTMSSRYMNSIETHQQGNGLLQAKAAWDLLQKLDASAPPLTIVSSAPVKTALSSWLEVPDQGVGIFEREGWKPGDAGQRVITFTRTGGPARPMTFRVSWQGDIETYKSATEVTLPLNTPVAFPVQISTQSEGTHSALLSLDHESIPGHAYRVMNTVVAAPSLDASNAYTMAHKADVPRPGKHSFYFHVPAGAATLKLDFKVPDGVIKLVFTPDNRVAYVQSSDYIVDRPASGVWEVLLSENTDLRKFSPGLPQPLPPTPTTITASLLNAGGDTMSVNLGPLLPGKSVTRELNLVNRGASFTGGLLTSPMGSVHRKTATIRNREQQVYRIDVPAGSTQLRVDVEAGTAGDVDLYLFDCTGDSCAPARSSLNPAGSESVVVNQPRAGQWKVVVDGARIASGRADYKYSDVIFNPRYGTIAVTDVPVERAIGAQWTASANIWLAQSLPAGREPYGAILIGSDQLRAAARYPGSPPLADYNPEASRQKQGPAAVGTIAVEMTGSP
ncbi:S8 family serine peptidase [Steroidobacter flavus]|uniref:S8 family serine peptidase n=1 Tax=Steroidobacter flavus TaxID=1842136 RepID=A0ABV8T403_9GAMM